MRGFGGWGWRSLVVVVVVVVVVVAVFVRERVGGPGGRRCRTFSCCTKPTCVTPVTDEPLFLHVHEAKMNRAHTKARQAAVLLRVLEHLCFSLSPVSVRLALLERPDAGLVGEMEQGMTRNVVEQLVVVVVSGGQQQVAFPHRDRPCDFQLSQPRLQATVHGCVRRVYACRGTTVRTANRAACRLACRLPVVLLVVSPVVLFVV